MMTLSLIADWALGPSATGRHGRAASLGTGHVAPDGSPPILNSAPAIMNFTSCPPAMPAIRQAAPVT
jgi:hypothetical protein